MAVGEKWKSVPKIMGRPGKWEHDILVMVERNPSISHHLRNGFNQCLLRYLRGGIESFRWVS